VTPGLGLFRLKRRHWYVLEDWRLLSYKTREDADPSSPPLALVDLRDVAISVVPNETNQFKLVYVQPSSERSFNNTQAHTQTKSHVHATQIASCSSSIDKYLK